jgi:diaminopimelate decarboxylase
MDGATEGAEQPASSGNDAAESWRSRVAQAVDQLGTPCYVAAWLPVAARVSRFRSIQTTVPVRLWLSLKTHPLPPLAASWLRDGRGIEVVSESELLMALDAGATPDHILVNGVAKQGWLYRYPIPELQVHFDSPGEIDVLLPMALDRHWRVGIRVHVPDECDARDPRFGGQFGLTRGEALAAIRRLRAAGADLQRVHFHVGQKPRAPAPYSTAVAFVADICDEAVFSPRIVDCGGGLPSSGDAACGAAWADLAASMRLASDRFTALEEIWLENGRFVTDSSTVLAVRVVDVKERDDSCYLICDGGRTNQALAADAQPRPLVVPAGRSARTRLTTVCGPTCMTDDRLGRWPLPEDLQPGDVLVWPDAGAYHLPWETCFSHPRCAVAWYDERDRFTVARNREHPRAWAAQWLTHSHA